VVTATFTAAGETFTGSIAMTVPTQVQVVTATFAPGTSTGSIAMVSPASAQTVTATFELIFTGSVAMTAPAHEQALTGTFTPVLIAGGAEPRQRKRTTQRELFEIAKQDDEILLQFVKEYMKRAA